LRPKIKTLFYSLLILLGCSSPAVEDTIPSDHPYVVVLGIAQDGGFPQAGCDKECCKEAWENPLQRKMVVCLGLVDPVSGKKWLFEATPDIKDQIYHLKIISNSESSTIHGVFLTHAHIGHYTGLMHFGHEAMGAEKIPVFVMPRMKSFLSNSGPWDQLVRYQNIDLVDMEEDKGIQLTESLQITPFLVPHRDEYSETVGFRITGNNRSVIFIPDINKWSLWEKSIVEVIMENDLVLIDGSFFSNGEIPGRDMSEFPHPFIEESMDLFSALPANERRKVHFIHLNHTNPAMKVDGEARQEIYNSGYQVASQFQIIPL